MTKKKQTTIRPELLDELLQGCSALPTQEDLFGPEGVIKQLSKALIERCLEAELSTHLGYEKHERGIEEKTNLRNGFSRKTLKSEQGPVELAIPRDREGSYDPLLVKKYQTSLTGFNEKILWMYAHGFSTRDIQAQLLEWYGVEVSPTLISNVTEAVMDEVRQWQNRPLETLYPIMYVDCLVIKVRENQRILNKAVYLVLGITLEGQKELLGMWISENEGAKFWLAVCTDLRNRGMKDCYIACADGLTGLPEAIEAVFPHTLVQLCIVHLVRNSLKYVNFKQRAEVARDAENDLLCCYGGRGRVSVGDVRRKMGHTVSCDQSIVASALDARDTAFLFPRGDPARDLHDQCHRIAERILAESHHHSSDLSLG